jgi:hypothetical protein
MVTGQSNYETGMIFNEKDASEQTTHSFKASGRVESVLSNENIAYIAAFRHLEGSRIAVKSRSHKFFPNVKNIRRIVAN